MSANTYKAHVKILTLAIPIGEAASDIAGAMLRLDVKRTAVIQDQQLL